MLLSVRESFCAITHIFFAKNVKNLRNINLGTIKQVFTAINGILIVKLVRIDIKIKVLSLKVQQLQPVQNQQVCSYFSSTGVLIRLTFGKLAYTFLEE